LIYIIYILDIISCSKTATR